MLQQGNVLNTSLFDILYLFSANKCTAIYDQVVFKDLFYSFHISYSKTV